jgi:hypothetical protein
LTSHKPVEANLPPTASPTHKDCTSTHATAGRRHSLETITHWQHCHATDRGLTIRSDHSRRFSVSTCNMGSTLPTTASTKVFDVPELLENIISFVPAKYILTSAQRVSRAWKASVDASPGIQRKLLRRRGDEPVATPIRFLFGDQAHNEHGVEQTPIYHRTVHLNPLPEDASSLHPGCYIGLYQHPCQDWRQNQWHLRKDLEVGYDADGKPGFSNRSGSWRSMQVCDPPISVVLLFSQVMPVGDPGAPYVPENEICAAVLDRDGITMGLVWDTAATLLRNSDNRHWNFRMSFGVDSRDLRAGDGDAGDSDDGSDSGEEGDGDGDRSQDDGGEETGRGSISDEDADNEGGNGSGDDVNTLISNISDHVETTLDSTLSQNDDLRSNDSMNSVS